MYSTHYPSTFATMKASIEGFVMRWALLCATALMMGCGVNQVPSTNTLNGFITVRGERGDFFIQKGAEGSIGDYCFTTGGYSDLAEGATVVIQDGKAETIAVGRLQLGTFTLVEGSTEHCTFAFTVEEIPKSDFYSVEVSSRGKAEYTHEELEARGWMVAFELGR